MSLEQHRTKENLGGLVYLLTIDYSVVSGDPKDVLRIYNGYGQNGLGVTYQGNLFKPHPYEIQSVKRSSKSTKKGTKVSIADADYKISRFIKEAGGSIQNARIYEMKVFGRFLDNGVEPNQTAYSKRMDHIVNSVEDSDREGEILLNTLSPLSREIKVPTISFSAGVPNSSESAINIFPAVDRKIARTRNE